MSDNEYEGDSFKEEPENGDASDKDETDDSDKEAVSGEEGEGGEVEYDEDGSVREEKGSSASSNNNDRIYVVPKEECTTSNVLGAFEMVEIVSIRSAQIADNKICLADDVSDLTDATLMAKRELMQRRCPLVLHRYIGTYGKKIYYEYWNPNEMVFAQNF